MNSDIGAYRPVRVLPSPRLLARMLEQRKAFEAMLAGIQRAPKGG